eukprot:4930928-Pyramimonas_sp.AAC.1
MGVSWGSRACGLRRRGMSSPFRANDLAVSTSFNIAKRMPVTNPMLCPTLAPPMLRCIWGHVLTSQSSFRVTSEALNSAIWKFFS